MQGISENNIARFLRSDIKISSNVITTDLKTISRSNLLSRLFYRNKLDSVAVCSNLETALCGRQLNPIQKAVVQGNLNSMRAKFSKSYDRDKAEECTVIIDRILGTLFPTPTSKRSPSPSSSRLLIARPAAPGKLPPPKAPAMDPESLRKQRGIVKAISRDNRRIETSNVQFKGAVDRARARVEWIERSAGVDEKVRQQYIKKHGDYVRAVHYQHNHETYLIALIKENGPLGDHFQLASIPAPELKGYFERSWASAGSYDVGARLREQMAKMGLTLQIR